MPTAERMPHRYRFTGHERVLHNVRADQALPGLMALFGYRRAFIVCSRSLNAKTEVISRIRACLGDRLVGLTDDVGEHSPLSNVLKATKHPMVTRNNIRPIETADDLRAVMALAWRNPVVE